MPREEAVIVFLYQIVTLRSLCNVRRVGSSRLNRQYAQVFSLNVGL